MRKRAHTGRGRRRTVRDVEGGTIVRLPRSTKTLLDALSGLTGTPIGRLVQKAVSNYVDDLPDAEQQLLAEIRARRTIKSDGD